MQRSEITHTNKRVRSTDERMTNASILANFPQRLSNQNRNKCLCVLPERSAAVNASPSSALLPLHNANGLFDRNSGSESYFKRGNEKAQFGPRMHLSVRREISASVLFYAGPGRKIVF